jgi:hypothetical protein
MELLLHRVDPISLGLLVLVWLLVLVLAWWPRRPASRPDPVAGYLQWNRDHGMGHMSYHDYVKSGEAGGKTPGKLELGIIVTLIAALVLFVALQRWGALR